MCSLLNASCNLTRSCSCVKTNTGSSCNCLISVSPNRLSDMMKVIRTFSFNISASD